MTNTYVLDVDLVYHRVPSRPTDDLDEIDFVDMEPLDDLEEAVGVAPHDCVLLVPVEPYDVIGLQGGRAIAMAPKPGEHTFARYTIGTHDDLGVEDFDTDEYTAHDGPSDTAAFAC